jgi:ABC-type nitrate/sulfonate/bicarbonate transport system substrate-binding protein
MPTLHNRSCRTSLFLVALFWLAACGDKTRVETPQPATLKLSVGFQVSPAMALVMVAKDMGYFDKAGIDVELREFTAGKFALQAFLGGSLDIAVSGEVPVTLATLQGNNFRVIAQVVERTTNECRVVVRAEDGLDTAEKYFRSKRRKLATSFGGGPEFFTHNFRKRHEIADNQVEIFSQRPEDMPAALASGSVDAISIFDPFARIAEVRMGKQGRTFADPDIYSELYVVSVLQKTIDEKSEALVAFLGALNEAHLYLSAHPPEAKRIVIKYTKLDPQIVEDIWGNFVFKPVLNSVFVEYTAAEADWLVQKGTFPSSTTKPDFRRVVFPDLLRRVSKELVSIE